jgi:hypothetical protein
VTATAPEKTVTADDLMHLILEVAESFPETARFIAARMLKLSGKENG